MHSLVSRSTIWLFSSRLISCSSNFIHTTSFKSMPAKIGDRIPNVDLYEFTPTDKVNMTELCNKKKVVLFAVPGAFTPSCSKTHLPGFVKDSDLIKSKGIAEIVCVSVNDPFVMHAWALDQKAIGKVRMLADPNATFTKALDLHADLPALGGIRSKRYSMIIDDGIIKDLNVEPDGTGLTCSLSKHLKV